jgi:chromosome condensin MukBEF ATPase and DNA-binding subunit MukB
MWYRKAWIYLKKYWWVFTLTIATIIFLMLGKSTDILDEFFERKNKQSKEELDAIENGTKQIVKIHKENLSNYTQAVKELETAYDVKEDQITADTKRKMQKFVEEANSNPEDVAKRIAEENGWVYVE